MKTDFQPKPASLTLPTLAFPIKIGESTLQWYQEKPSLFSKLLKFPGNLLGNLFGLLSIPLFMTIDLTVGLTALLLSRFNQNLRQLAWDCLFCGSFGGIFIACHMLVRMIVPTFRSK